MKILTKKILKKKILMKKIKKNPNITTKKNFIIILYIKMVINIIKKTKKRFEKKPVKSTKIFLKKNKRKDEKGPKTDTKNRSEEEKEKKALMPSRSK